MSCYKDDKISNRMAQGNHSSYCDVVHLFGLSHWTIYLYYLTWNSHSQDLQNLEPGVLPIGHQTTPKKYCSKSHFAKGICVKTILLKEFVFLQNKIILYEQGVITICSYQSGNNRTTNLARQVFIVEWMEKSDHNLSIPIWSCCKKLTSNPKNLT